MKKGKHSETGMRGSLRTVSSDEDLDQIIKSHGADRLLVVYFSLTWCGSCQKMNPAVEALAVKYSSVSFVQVNADKVPHATKKNDVNKVPVFLLLLNRVTVDRVEGASPSELESKIKRNIAEAQFQKQGLIPPHYQKPDIIPHSNKSKMQDVTPYLDKSQCRCINDLIPTPFQAFLEGKKLVSGKGVGRLILVYAFTEKMVITALKVKAPVYSGPKVMRFFVNLHKVLDFSIVSQMSSAHELTINEEDLTGEHAIEIRSGGIVGVISLQIYIPENMTKNRKTEIESLTLIGAPMSQTSYANADSTKGATHSTTHRRRDESSNSSGSDAETYPRAHQRTPRAGTSRKKEKADAFAAT